MATRCLTRSLLATTTTTTTKSIIATVSRTYSTSSLFFRLRPLVAAAASSSYCRRISPVRGFSTRQTSSSLNDPNPNWSTRPPKETILLDGCDFEHWLVVVEKPEGEPTRDEIIDSYIKTLAMVVGSEEEARMKIYSVSTRHYFAFGALVSEELSLKLKDLPKVRWVLPDSYLDVRNKDYGGEPFINGQAVPYDSKYHEEWVRNNARANERNKRNDRPRNFDRSRNFDRRREMQNSNSGGPGGNMMGPPNMNNRQPSGPNQGAPQSNMGGQPNYRADAPPINTGNYPPQNNIPSNAYQYGNGPNSSGGMPYQSGAGPNQNFNPNMGSGQGQNQNTFPPNAKYGPGSNQYGPPNMGPGPQNNYAANMGNSGVQNQNGYGPNMTGGNSQHQNVPGRDMPPPSSY